MGRGERRWLASERIAIRVLESMGYRVVETRKKVRVGGVDVAEVDAVAVGPDGETYAVEVKAGRLDVTGVRQAYSNAVLLGAKPLVVCKGFADDAAKAMAERLGVRVIELSDVFLVDAEELEDLVYTAVAEALMDVLRVLLDPTVRVKPKYLDALRAIAEEPTPLDAASRLGVGVDQLSKLVAEMRREGVIPGWARRWQVVRAVAALVTARARLQALIDSLERAASRLEEACRV